VGKNSPGFDLAAAVKVARMVSHGPRRRGEGLVSLFFELLIEPSSYYSGCAHHVAAMRRPLTPRTSRLSSAHDLHQPPLYDHQR
jgi:hypothetical protein